LDMVRAPLVGRRRVNGRRPLAVSFRWAALRPF
jgi:hypothetical protein